MTTDERLDRLTERTDSIAQSVELLTHDVHELQITVKKQSDNLDKVIIIVEEMQPLVKSFMAFAMDHEQRLRRLEGE